jgi:transposase-like protein
MTKPIGRDTIYRCRRFSAETIELCVRWYITYRLSYRDLAAMMAERDVIVSHTTIMRWVLRYAPEYERRWARFSRPPGESWRMDETAVSVRGGRHYLFRAVDKNGKSIGSLLCNDRNKESAQAFFRAAVADGRVQWGYCPAPQVHFEHRVNAREIHVPWTPETDRPGKME